MLMTLPEHGWPGQQRTVRAQRRELRPRDSGEGVQKLRAMTVAKRLELARSFAEAIGGRGHSSLRLPTRQHFCAAS